jgi:hypothetical protein
MTTKLNDEALAWYWVVVSMQIRNVGTDTISDVGDHRFWSFLSIVTRL